MSVSFNVTLSDYRVFKYVSRPCFAAVNQAVNGLQDNISVANIEYIPFLNNHWDDETGRNREMHKLPDEMSWEIAEKWWTYLVNLPYFSKMVYDVPQYRNGYKHGIKVNTNYPADRVMLCLFLLRAPQFQAGIVRTWYHLITKFEASEDVAFVTAFALNNKPYASTPVDSESDPSDAIQRMYIHTDQESTIIYPQYFSLKGAKLLLNRLLCDDPDEELYSGIQPAMRRGKYERYNSRNKRALGRFFAKKPGCRYSTGNLQVTIWNDILRDQRSPVTTHNDLCSLPQSAFRFNDNQMRELLTLMES